MTVINTQGNVHSDVLAAGGLTLPKAPPLVVNTDTWALRDRNQPVLSLFGAARARARDVLEEVTHFDVDDLYKSLARSQTLQRNR